MRFLIPKGNEKDSGIYIIRNSVNSKVYVGSAASFKKRFSAHLNSLKRGDHHSKLLQRFSNKYGLETLSFELVATCCIESLISTEQHFIVFYKAADAAYGFNHCPIAGSTRGFSPTKETRRKISETQRGRKLSPDFCAKLSIAQTGRKHSQETKDKIGAAHKGKQISGETKAYLSALYAGKGPGPAATEKARLVNTGRKRCFSQETIAKRVASRAANKTAKNKHNETPNT